MIGRKGHLNDQEEYDFWVKKKAGRSHTLTFTLFPIQIKREGIDFSLGIECEMSQ